MTSVLYRSRAQTVFMAVCVLFVCVPAAVGKSFGSGQFKDDRAVKMQVNFAKAEDIVRQLNEEIRAKRLIGITAVYLSDRDNSVIIRGEDDAIRDAKEFIRLIDIQMKTIRMQLTAVLVEPGPGRHPRRNVIYASALVLPGDISTIRGSVGNGRSPATSGPSGILNVRTQPRINGDDSVTLDARGEVEMIGEASRIRREFDMTATIPNGRSGLLLDTASGTGAMDSARLLVFASVAVVERGEEASIPVESMVFVDFESPTLGGDKSLGRQAAEVAAVEIANSGQFEVLKRDETLRTAAEFGFKSPWTPDEYTRIASSLGASLVLEGRILFTYPSDAVLKGPARAGVSMRIWQPATGETVYAATANGESKAIAGVRSNDELLLEAVASAAQRAARKVCLQVGTAGEVMHDSGERSPGLSAVLVNRGRANKYNPGLDLLVFRGNRYQGKLRVVKASDSNSECEVLSSNGSFRPLDVVRPTGVAKPVTTILPPAARVSYGGHSAVKPKR